MFPSPAINVHPIVLLGEHHVHVQLLVLFSYPIHADVSNPIHVSYTHVAANVNVIAVVFVYGAHQLIRNHCIGGGIASYVYDQIAQVLILPALS